MAKQLINLFTFFPKKIIYSTLTNNTKKIKSLDDQYKNVLHDIEIKGFHVINNFLPEKIINKINDELNEIQNSNYENKVSFQSYGVNRYLKIDKYSDTAREHFFNNEFINKISKLYVSNNVKQYQKMYEIKGGEGLSSVSDIFHFDDWKKRFKAFLYLNDVDENNCPFTILPFSYQKNFYRLRKELEYSVFGKKGAYGYYLNHEIDFLTKKYDLNPVSIKGNKGTLILTDTRFLHKGTPSIGNNFRHLLAAYFDLRK